MASRPDREDLSEKFAEEDPAVVDEPDAHRLVVRADGSVAELVYRQDEDRLTLVHVEVPDAIAGRGIGAHLVRAAIKRAAVEGLSVVPSCPFARQWLRHHPEAWGGLTIDWRSTPRAP